MSGQKVRQAGPAPAQSGERGSPPSDPQAVLRLAAQHHQAGRLDEAAPLYALVLETDPDNADANHLRGLLALHRGNPSDAVALIERAIAAQPRVAAYHGSRAQALGALGRVDDAIASYRGAIDLDGSSPAAPDGLGKLLRRVGRLDEAIAVLKAAITANPGCLPLHMNLGNAYQAGGKLGDAEACYRDALAIDGDSGAAHANLALALFLLGDREDAIRHYRAALAHAPDAAEIHLGLGWALFGAAHLDEAKACFERALALSPGLAEAHVKLGLVQLAEGALDAALASAARSAELFRAPPRTTARFKLRHDLEQLDHLRRSGVIADVRHAASTARLTAARDSLPEALPDDRAIALSGAQSKALAEAMPRVLPDCPALADGALGPGLDANAIQAAYFAATPSVATIDGLLSAPALDALRRFCWGATIWNDVKPGYLGAYLKDGFACGLLLQIAAELRARLPKILADLTLIEMWAYKYDQKLGGIETHADCAAVNLNFWIAPDEANLDGASGGLTVYTREAPLDWDFNRYNCEADAIEGFLDQAGRDAVTVTHRSNRAVMFNSNLFHRTDRFHFRPGYENRRINVTLLFGHRASRR